MFMIWDSRHEDLQLFWLSFKHWTLVLTLVDLIDSGRIVCVGSASEIQLYIVMSSFIGWVHTQSDPLFTHILQGCFTGPSASEVTLKVMGTIDRYQTTT